MEQFGFRGLRLDLDSFDGDKTIELEATNPHPENGGLVQELPNESTGSRLRLGEEVMTSRESRIQAELDNDDEMTKKGNKNSQLSAIGLGRYLDFIGRFKNHELEEERTLFADYHAVQDAQELLLAEQSPEERAKLETVVANGQAARQKLAEHNLRFVVYMAKRYQRPGVSIEDLIQWGNEGLLEAIDKYDPARGARLTTFASYAIRKKILEGLAYEGYTVKTPLNVHNELTNYRSMKKGWKKEGKGNGETFNEELEKQGLREADYYEKILQMRNPETLEAVYSGSRQDKAFYRQVMAAGAVEQSIDYQASDDESFGDYTATDLWEDYEASVEEAVHRKLEAENVHKVLASLPERERIVLELRFGLFGKEKRTLDEVGLYLGFSRERIRQLEARALSKLRHPQNSLSLWNEDQDISPEKAPGPPDDVENLQLIFNNWTDNMLALKLEQIMEEYGQHEKFKRMMHRLYGRYAGSISLYRLAGPIDNEALSKRRGVLRYNWRQELRKMRSKGADQREPAISPAAYRVFSGTHTDRSYKLQRLVLAASESPYDFTENMEYILSSL